MVDSNHADPGVLKLPDNSGYVAVSTGIYSDGIFPILYSEDMVNWIYVIWSYHLNICSILQILHYVYFFPR